MGNSVFRFLWSLYLLVILSKIIDYAQLIFGWTIHIQMCASEEKKSVVCACVRLGVE